MKISKAIKQKTTVITKKVKRISTNHPLRLFYASLALLVLAIVLGNLIRTPKKAEAPKALSPKEVQVYAVGGSPRITVTAKVEKSGVIQIVALTGGVVSKINVKEGSTVKKGTTLMNIASNYQGGNTFSLQRKIAATQYQNTTDTYQSQKDLIQKQKDLADQSQQNFNQLRDITNASISETKSLISINSNIISTLDSDLASLETDPVTNADLILATKQMKSQFIAGQNQSQSALRQAEYQVNTDNPPTDLSNLQRDITVAQLDLQAKSLDMNKELSRLQLQIAQVTEGMTAPAAPFSGVVQRVFVKQGQVIQPGTPLAIVSQQADDPITVIAYVNKRVADSISKIETARIHIGKETLALMPSYISTDAVKDELYAVYFNIPDSYLSKVTDNGYVSVDLALGYQDSISSAPYIPLDAIHQTASGAFVFVAQNNKVSSKPITLGTIFGSLVEVDGLAPQELIILDRTVTDGSTVQVVH